VVLESGVFGHLEWEIFECLEKNACWSEILFRELQGLNGSRGFAPAAPGPGLQKATSPESASQQGPRAHLIHASTIVWGGRGVKPRVRVEAGGSSPIGSQFREARLMETHHGMGSMC